MADGVILSAAEYRLFVEMTRWYRQRPGRPGDRYGIDAGQDAAVGNNLFVCRAPAGGIPAVNLGANTGTGTSSSDYGDDIPGGAVCKVFSVVTVSGTRYLRPHGTTELTVLNLSYGAVDPGAWVVVAQDRFGSWFVLNTIGKDFGVC